MQHCDTTMPSFDRSTLLLNNVWSANALARRCIHQRFPYLPVDMEKGRGFEDWTFNLATVQAGVHHRVAPNTVHLIRMKPEGSLGQKGMKAGLLPALPSNYSLDEWL
jgi:hypothetical protein